MSDPTYCYPPEFSVLQNRAGLQEQDSLTRFENRMVGIRLSEEIPRGDFSLNHLRAIHHHLFQDVYEWAGEVRQIDIGKGGTAFLPVSRIELGMSDVHERLIAQDYLRGLERPDFARSAAETLGDVNYVHPFREGNGRTQFQYLKQLSERAGHPIDLSQFDRESWISASIKTCLPTPNYKPMERCIDDALTRTRQREETQSEYDRLADDIERDATDKDSHSHDHDDEHER